MNVPQQRGYAKLDDDEETRNEGDESMPVVVWYSKEVTYGFTQNDINLNLYYVGLYFSSQVSFSSSSSTSSSKSQNILFL